MASKALRSSIWAASGVAPECRRRCRHSRGRRLVRRRRRWTTSRADGGCAIPVRCCGSGWPSSARRCATRGSSPPTRTVARHALRPWACSKSRAFSRVSRSIASATRTRRRRLRTWLLLVMRSTQAVDASKTLLPGGSPPSPVAASDLTGTGAGSPGRRGGLVSRQPARRDQPVGQVATQQVDQRAASQRRTVSVGCCATPLRKSSNASGAVHLGVHPSSAWAREQSSSGTLNARSSHPPRSMCCNRARHVRSTRVPVRRRARERGARLGQRRRHRVPSEVRRRG